MIKKLSPIQISTSLDFHNGYANIENKTDRDWSDILVMVQDSYAQDVVIWKGEVPSKRIIEFQFSKNLPFYHFENGLRMRVFSSNQKIYERIFDRRRIRAS